MMAFFYVPLQTPQSGLSGVFVVFSWPQKHSTYKTWGDDLADLTLNHHLGRRIFMCGTIFV